jgi:hypothetical protein
MIDFNHTKKMMKRWGLNDNKEHVFMMKIIVFHF